jgi:hypothetical protein
MPSLKRGVRATMYYRQLRVVIGQYRGPGESILIGSLGLSCGGLRLLHHNTESGACGEILEHGDRHYGVWGCSLGRAGLRFLERTTNVLGRFVEAWF